MIKSLYIRVIVTFLTAVLAGIIIAFTITFLIYQERLNENLQTTLLHYGQDIARIYETVSLQEADLIVSGMNQVNSYNIRIYDETGQIQYFGALQGQKPTILSMADVKKVMAGEVIQVDPSITSQSLLGLPMKTESGTKALFIESLTSPKTNFTIKWLHTFFIYFLSIGSLLILVASLFLVRPIKKLTEATRRIASGDFNIKLNIKQTGELGTLAQSFEQMMVDLRQLEQMRRDFVSNVSHEVQSPLTSISGYAMALKQVNIPDKERSRYLDIIISEATRMSKMSDSLLKLSLLESQSQQMQLTSFRLDEQIRRVIVAIQPQWSARNIQFELNLKAAMLIGDYDQLNQVWTNILGNSIKFSEDGGRISVSMKQDIKYLTVRITDSGIGISLEDQKHIFERFFKADRSHSRKYDGSGMGLAIVKQIVSLHQGDIRVESEPGMGTTFIVTLPTTMATD
ncbi:sensor histidine kinase [Paenibacillus paridis]|uniref:sensor histidine kinase n=1 Tax=Paenibacillus paridis TaxID=2583376 RepID=UPI0011209E84|nr:HAMP domain-containing sensor histidine kinase [Paenibacillus paridis]